MPVKYSELFGAYLNNFSIFVTIDSYGGWIVEMIFALRLIEKSISNSILMIKIRVIKTIIRFIYA
jgi:hypothetical protein